MEMGVEYGGIALIGNTVANKDDRYSVSLKCRYDDDGDNAGNEWKGAWLHCSPVEIELHRISPMPSFRRVQRLTLDSPFG